METTSTSAGAQRAPQRGAVRLGAQGWGAHEVQLPGLEVGLVQVQVVGAGLGVDVDARSPGPPGRPAARRRSRGARRTARRRRTLASSAARRIASASTDGGRTDGTASGRSGLRRSPRPTSDSTVAPSSACTQTRTPVSSRRGQRPPEGLVVDHQPVGVGHVELHAGDAVLDEVGEPPAADFGPLRQLGHRQVEAVVDDGPATAPDRARWPAPPATARDLRRRSR